MSYFSEDDHILFMFGSVFYREDPTPLHKVATQEAT
jgi:hypothetical protein